jgi:hypothetical protein
MRVSETRGSEDDLRDIAAHAVLLRSTSKNPGHGENDPDFYTLLQNDARDGLPENQFDRNVWASLSDSEESLRAVNTWDAAFLSAGPFQHTAGTNGGKGELPGVLDTVQEHAPEAYWRHFGRFGLQPVGTEISAGAKYGYFELRGTTLDTPEKKKKLRRFKWPHRFREALRDENISRWVLTEGFRRLDRIRDRTLTLEVKTPSREEPITFDARIGDLFRRDLMQALLLDWHINYPAEVWKQELGEWYIDEGEQKYDPGNQWRDHLQDHLQTWAGEWSQTLTEALPLEEDDDGNRMLNGPVDLNDAEAYELAASLLGARTEGVMTDPVGRAADILGYTNNQDVQNLATVNQDPPQPQTVPAFLTQCMNLEDNDRYTGENVWNTIQNQNRQSLSFDSPAEN